jgi:hypothetical protein
MAFILPDDYPQKDLTAFRQAWDRYAAYLEEIRDHLPHHTAAFATAAWHYDPTDPRCPHDAWVETVTFRETARNETLDERSLHLSIELLGAYHNGTIQLEYQDVTAYTLAKPFDSSPRASLVAHDDWLVDEIRLHERGNVIHEVVFASGAHWTIECKDMRYRWAPNE